MIIRTEKAHDINAIEQLTLAAFTNHPHHPPGKAPNEHRIINHLREDQSLILSLVAEDENGIIGHLAYSPISIAGKQSAWLVLAPVSVAPARQNQGVGSKLIIKSLELITAQNIEGAVVLGDPDYYARFGFNTYHKLHVAGIAAEYFMALKLNSAVTAPPCGAVTFHNAFNC